MRALHAWVVAALAVVLVLSSPLLLARDVSEARSAARSADLDAEYRFSRLGDLDPARDVLVIRAPAVGYDADEVRELRAFLLAGGGAVVLDDVGSARDLLERLGAGIGTTGARVFTPAFSERPDRIVAVHDGDVSGLPLEVVVTRPVGVVGGEAILRTPDLAWVDANDNGRPDLGEPVRVTVVAARTHVGPGTLVVLGDPDLLAPSTPDAVKRALLEAAAPDAERAVFDLGHARFSDPFALNDALAGRASAVARFAILMSSLALAAFVVLGPRLSEARRRKSALKLDGIDPRIAREALSELEPR